MLNVTRMYAIIAEVVNEMAHTHRQITMIVEGVLVGSHEFKQRRELKLDEELS